MSIKLTIHSIDVKNKSAVVTLMDGEHVIIGEKNLQIELNEDGTSANTVWLNKYIKDYVFSQRITRIAQSEEDII